MPLPRTDPSCLRLAAYNILNGGTGRHEPIAETLRWLDADLVGLIEADDPEFVAYLAEKLDYHHALAHADTAHHVALLSRTPIDRAINLKPRCPSLHRTAMEAVVTINDRPIRLVVTHLRAGIGLDREAVRMVELDELLPVLAEADDLPTVLMGDFNSNAPYHPVDADRARPKTRAVLDQQNGVVPHDVVDRMIDLGYIDAIHQADPENITHTLSTGYPAHRVDYIWLDPTLAAGLHAADVETGGFTRYCSDHYPVWADVKFTWESE